MLLSLAVLVVALTVTRVGAEHTRVPVPAPGDDFVVTLLRVGAYVEEYYARAQSIVALERVMLQPLSSSFSPADRVRRLENELRMEWTPAADGKPASAHVIRQLLKVDGRVPRPKDEPGCTDPRGVSPEPLAMLLPAQQSEFVFRSAGMGKTDGRAAAMLDYRAVTQGPIETVWKKDCVSIELPGRSVGRIWVDPRTGEVLRLDEQLKGMYDIPVPREQQLRGGSPSMTIERSDTSTKYKPVTFHDPEETMLMPASIDTITIVRDSGTPRLRMSQVFSNYRRFVTGGRIVD